MKNFYLLLIIPLFTMHSFAQSPTAFKYQAVLRDASGNVKANASANIRIDILQGSATGTNVFAETFAAQTNAFGLINLEIGKGTLVSGNITMIDWSAGAYFIKISVDGTEMGTSQLLSVPYALFAAKAGNAFSGNYNELSNKPTNVSSFTNDAGYLTSATESDPKIGANTTNYIPKWDGTKLISSTIIDNGKIGIDITPSFKLDVKGSINVPIDSGYRINKQLVLSTKGSQNVFVGMYAGPLNTGNSNNFFGYQAGNTNAGGNYNNFIGYQAGYSNTTGGGNNFLGRYAGFSNTTTFWNTFIGDRAGYHNSIGDRNVFVGADAGYTNSSGQYNSYVGLGAGYYNAAGSYGCYYGYQAGYNTTANYNSYYGYQAGFTNTTGMGNSFYGRLAGYTNNGAWNTFLGDRAGTNNTTGTQNIVIGSDAGLTLTTGGYNVLIGNASDVSTAALTNAIAIGYNADVNASNKIRLGNASITVIEGQVAFTSASDMRLKKNINDISSGLDFVMKLRPVEYQMKQGDDRINFGFIAQDIEKLLGTSNNLLTIGGDKDRTLGLRYTDFISPMVKAMQEQQKQIEAQQKQIDELKQLVVKLTQK